MWKGKTPAPTQILVVILSSDLPCLPLNSGG